jgi:hypothetical protein
MMTGITIVIVGRHKSYSPINDARSRVLDIQPKTLLTCLAKCINQGGCFIYRDGKKRNKSSHNMLKNNDFSYI